MKVNPFRLFLLLALSLIALLTACNALRSPTPPTLPTARVPPLDAIDRAIEQWKSANNQRYFAVVEETTQQGTFSYRIVFADGSVRAAQRLEKIGGTWQPPTPLDPESARQYTVDALLERIRRDALGLGPAPLDMTVIFDPLSGFPSVVEAIALPTYQEDGTLRLNREHNYSFTLAVDALIEDTVALGKPPLMLVTRSGGPAAYCDTLRIYPDRSSIYTDDCRQILLQLSPPAASLETILSLTQALPEIDQSREEGGAVYRLHLFGTGPAPADETLTNSAWELAHSLAELLSRPIGAGITLLYTDDHAIFGLDMRTTLSQPAAIQTTPPVYGAAVSPDESNLAYADGSGVHWVNLENGDTGLLLANPPEGHYRLHGWNGQSQLILQRVDADAAPPEWGWASLAERFWHPLPLETGAFACDSGVDVNPVGSELAIAAGGACQAEAGLSLVSPEAGSLRKLIDSTAVPGGGAFDPAWSPDGSWIAFSLALMDTPENASRIFLIHPDGTALTQITENNAGQARSPAWSADGTRLYYTLQAAGEAEDGVYEYNLETGNHTLLIPGENLRPLSVSPSGEFLVFQDQSNLVAWMLTHDQAIPVAAATDEGVLPQFVGWLDDRVEE